jgi:hypothetical protein
MVQIFITFIAVFTSVIAYHTTKRTLSTGGTSMRRAVHAFFEWIGAFAFFLVFNLVLGTVILLLIRSFTGRFVPLYDLLSDLLFVFSAAQGFVFQMWWKRD